MHIPAVLRWCGLNCPFFFIWHMFTLAVYTQKLSHWSVWEHLLAHSSAVFTYAVLTSSPTISVFSFSSHPWSKSEQKQPNNIDDTQFEKKTCFLYEMTDFVHHGVLQCHINGKGILKENPSRHIFDHEAWLSIHLHTDHFHRRLLRCYFQDIAC